MTAETLENLLTELTSEFSLPAEDVAALRLLAQRLRAAVDQLEEVDVEPASIFKVVP
jgi:hypothetical protein